MTKQMERRDCHLPDHACAHAYTTASNQRVITKQASKRTQARFLAQSGRSSPFSLNGRSAGGRAVSFISKRGDETRAPQRKALTAAVTAIG